MTQDTWGRFERVVKGGSKTETMAALIIDSPWLPGYAGVPTLDFYFDPRVWIETYTRARADLPGAALLPGAWVEFGMATEPTGWGVPVKWNAAQPPDVGAHAGGLAALSQMDTPDPEKDGMMPVVLRQYERLMPELRARGLAPRMAAARGPLAVASHLLGITDFLMATQTDREACLALLDRTTDLCIRWLKAQLARMEAPVGVLVLDDLVGMLGPEDVEEIAVPRMRRIFAEFPSLIRVYHNDTPNDRIYGQLRGIGMNVFNFTHQTDIVAARGALGPDIVLMGNLPPLDLLVRGTPVAVRKATEQLLARLDQAGPVLVSPGGGVSPGTPLANLRALLDVVG